jgi:antirestriction protein ArdC
MSKKTMNEAVAQQLIEQLQAGTSPFQAPGFRMPVNPTTGKPYRAMTALALALQDKADPRWMTLRQASNNKWKVEKGSKGTLINFLKTQDRVQLLDESGERKLNSKNKPVTQLIKLEKPFMTNAFVFNADQIEGIPALAEYLEEKAAARRITPEERVARLVEESGARIEYGYPEPGYDAVDDEIFMPSKAEYEEMNLPQSFEAAQLYELALWTAHEDRMNRPADNPVAEEMRAAIASLMLGGELGVGAFTDPQTDFENWVELLQTEPDQLERIATDAQYIADYLRKFEQTLEQKQAPANRSDRTLQVGDTIPYNNTAYEITGKLKKNALQVQEKENGNRFRISPGDGIYNSLLQAKKQMLQQPELKQDQGQDLQREPEEEHSMQEEHDMEQEHEDTGFELVLNQEENEGRTGGRKM